MKLKIKINTRTATLYAVRIAMLSAMSLALMYFSFPILPTFSFLKLDFADIPVLLGALAMGPWSGVLISLIKCLLYLPTSIGNTLGIGALSNFMLASTLSLISGYVYKIRKNFVFAVIALIAGIIGTMAVACFTNWFIIFPMYGSFMNYNVIKRYGLAVLYAGIIPFNLIKYSITAVVVLPIYKVMSKFVLKGDNIFGIKNKKQGVAVNNENTELNTAGESNENNENNKNEAFLEKNISD